MGGWRAGGPADIASGGGACVCVCACMRVHVFQVETAGGRE